MLSNTLVLLACLTAPDYFSQQVLENEYNKISPAVVLMEYSVEITNANSGNVSKQKNNALGVLVSADGLVMSHGHMVVENKEPFNIMVTVGQGDAEKRYEAELLKKPDTVNVVFLKLLEVDAGTRFPYLRFASSAPKLGDPISIIGIYGESLDYSRGILPARIGAILEKPRKTYCLDRNIRFGFVGGPVINTRGQIIGVVGFDLKHSEGGDLYTRSGHPLLYQSSLFKDFIKHPPGTSDAEGDGDDAWLGVFTQPLTDDFAAYWGLDSTGGLIISTVVPGSPAAEAGLLSGDIIKSFAGTPIRAKLDRDVLGFTKLVREAGAHSGVDIHLLRKGEPISIHLTLGVRPRSSIDANEYEDTIFGLTVREITTDLRIALNLSEDVKGVIVRRVKSGSAAQVARMRPGVIIMNFGDYPVSSLDEFKSAVEKVVEKKPNEVSVFARAGSATGFFRLAPHWDK